ncbi:MAG: uroporphyrinogen decarboxylase family protein [Bacillota bacterium]
MAELTSLERIRRAVDLKEPDVVPVAPYMGNHGAQVAGVPIDRYCTNGEIMAEAQLAAWRKYGQDVVVAQSDNYYIAEGFGIETEIRANSTPTLKKPVVNELKDVYKLKVPNPWIDGRMPVYLDAISRLSKAVGDRVAVRGCGTGPFSLASHLMGTQEFLIQLAMAQHEPDGEDYKALRTLMDLTTDALIAFCKAQLEAGAHLVQCGDSLASIDMISPAMYESWAFPYEKRFCDEMRDTCKKYGGYTILHICGNATKVLDLYADTGAHIVELDFKVDMAYAKQRIGHRACLLGNLNPTEVLLQGTPADVERASAAVIAAAGKGGGLILGSGCEVPPYAPEENMQAMVRTARFHRYPL